MNFYVIYSFDVTKDARLDEYLPPHPDKWEQTEDDSLYDYGYLGDYVGEEYEDGQHRKFCAFLNKQEFKDFVEYCGMRYEDVDTMGSLTSFGWLPALSFHGYEDSWNHTINQSAYVTPFPEPVRDFHDHFNHEPLPGFEFTEEEKEEYIAIREKAAWDILKAAFRKSYGR